MSLAEIARTYPDLTEDERDILVNIRRRKMELLHEIRYSLWKSIHQILQSSSDDI